MTEVKQWLSSEDLQVNTRMKYSKNPKTWELEGYKGQAMAKTEDIHCFTGSGKLRISNIFIETQSMPSLQKIGLEQYHYLLILKQCNYFWNDNSESDISFFFSTYIEKYSESFESCKVLNKLH